MHTVIALAVIDSAAGASLQAVLCTAMAVTTCVAAYLVFHPAAVSAWYGLAIGALFAVVLLAARAALLELEFTVKLKCKFVRGVSAPPLRTPATSCMHPPADLRKSMPSRHTAAERLMMSQEIRSSPVSLMTLTSPRARHRASKSASLHRQLRLLCTQQQKRLVAEHELAGRHSRFTTLEGVQVHHTVEKPPPDSHSYDSSIAAAHCYHGFGANTFSWSFTQVSTADWHCGCTRATTAAGTAQSRGTHWTHTMPSEHDIKWDQDGVVGVSLRLIDHRPTWRKRWARRSLPTTCRALGSPRGGCGTLS